MPAHHGPPSPFGRLFIVKFMDRVTDKLCHYISESNEKYHLHVFVAKSTYIGRVLSGGAMLH